MDVDINVVLQDFINSYDDYGRNMNISDYRNIFYKYLHNPKEESELLPLYKKELKHSFKYVKDLSKMEVGKIYLRERFKHNFKYYGWDNNPTVSQVIICPWHVGEWVVQPCLVQVLLGGGYVNHSLDEMEDTFSFNINSENDNGHTRYFEIPLEWIFENDISLNEVNKYLDEEHRIVKP